MSATLSKPLPTKTVGFKTNPRLWNQFKSDVYGEGLEISKVLTALIQLYLKDEEVRDRARQLALTTSQAG